MWCVPSLNVPAGTFNLAPPPETVEVVPSPCAPSAVKGTVPSFTLGVELTLAVMVMACVVNAGVGDALAVVVVALAPACIVKFRHHDPNDPRVLICDSRLSR